MSENSLIINYPLEEYYFKRNEYISKTRDAPFIDKDIHEKWFSCFDVSDALSFFPHLELDPDYRLICYLLRDYIGICGEVAALKNNEAPKTYSGKSLLPYPELPDASVSPIEVIYNDDTPESLFESVLFSQLLDELTHKNFQHYTPLYIIDAPPANFNEFYTATVSVSDWRPRFAENKITVFEKICGCISNSYNPTDYIILTEYTFCDNLEQYRYYDTLDLYRFGLGSLIKDLKPPYPNTIKDDSRYNDKRRCCMFHASSTRVAEEK